MRYLILCVFLAGCATSFQTRPYDPGKDGGTINGIVYYNPAVFLVTYGTSTLEDKDGAFQGSSDAGACKAVPTKAEVQILPDYASPRVFLNTSDAFSTGKVGVSLSQGMITAINVENAPPVAGIATPAGVITSAAITKFGASGVPACNSGPVILSIKKLEK